MSCEPWGFWKCRKWLGGLLDCLFVVYKMLTHYFNIFIEALKYKHHSILSLCSCLFIWDNQTTVDTRPAQEPSIYDKSNSILVPKKCCLHKDSIPGPFAELLTNTPKDQGVGKTPPSKNIVPLLLAMTCAYSCLMCCLPFL